MLEHNIGSLPVVNRRGEICGFVTESDFVAEKKGIPFSFYRFPWILGQWMPKEGVENVYATARSMTVGEIMNRNVVSVREDDTLEVLLEKMLQSGYHRLPVLQGKTPVGIVARHDLLKLMFNASRTPGRMPELGIS